MQIGPPLFCLFLSASLCFALSPPPLLLQCIFLHVRASQTTHPTPMMELENSFGEEHSQQADVRPMDGEPLFHLSAQPTTDLRNAGTTDRCRTVLSSEVIMPKDENDADGWLRIGSDHGVLFWCTHWRTGCPVQKRVRPHPSNAGVEIVTYINRVHNHPSTHGAGSGQCPHAVGAPPIPTCDGSNHVVHATPPLLRRAFMSIPVELVTKTPPPKRRVSTSTFIPVVPLTTPPQLVGHLAALCTCSARAPVILDRRLLERLGEPLPGSKDLCSSIMKMRSRESVTQPPAWFGSAIDPSSDRDGLVLEEIQTFFTQIFVCPPVLSARQAVALLIKLNHSSEKTDRIVGRCLILSLHAQCGSLEGKCARPVHIMGVLFGQMIKREVFNSGIDIEGARKRVLVALRSSPVTNAFKFGMLALAEFKAQLVGLPQYTAHLLEIPTLRQADPELYAFIAQMATVSSQVDVFSNSMLNFVKLQSGSVDQAGSRPVSLHPLSAVSAAHPGSQDRVNVGTTQGSQVKSKRKRSSDDADEKLILPPGWNPKRESGVIKPKPTEPRPFAKPESGVMKLELIQFKRYQELELINSFGDKFKHGTTRTTNTCTAPGSFEAPAEHREQPVPICETQPYLLDPDFSTEHFYTGKYFAPMTPGRERRRSSASGRGASKKAMPLPECPSFAAQSGTPSAPNDGKE